MSICLRGASKGKRWRLGKQWQVVFQKRRVQNRMNGCLWRLVGPDMRKRRVRRGMRLLQRDGVRQYVHLVRRCNENSEHDKCLHNKNNKSSEGGGKFDAKFVINQCYSTTKRRTINQDLKYYIYI